MRTRAQDKVLLHCMWLYGNLEEGSTRPTVSKTDWEWAIDRVEQKILNYCSIKTIPESHLYTWAEIVVDFINYWLEATVTPNEEDGENEGEISGSVESIKVGDVTVGLGSKVVSNNPMLDTIRKNALASHLPKLDDFLLDHKDDLRQIRRMSWRKR